MSDAREKLRDIAEDIYFEGHDLGISGTHDDRTSFYGWADRMIEIVRSALLSDEVVEEVAMRGSGYEHEEWDDLDPRSRGKQVHHAQRLVQHVAEALDTAAPDRMAARYEMREPEGKDNA